MFEYKILKSKELITEEALNEFGKNGWALVEIVTSDYHSAFTFFTFLGRVVDESSWEDKAYDHLRLKALEETPSLDGD